MRSVHLDLGAARIRVALITALALGLVLGFSVSARAALLPLDLHPLPGSPLQFEGGDGNQVVNNVPPDDDNTDWETLTGVRSFPDPQEDDNIFTEGSKITEPGGWALGEAGGANGSTPGKDNILDAYTRLDEAANGDLYVYLAFTRFANNGTTYLGFELNQSPDLWTNAEGAEIVCRQTGDIIVAAISNGNQIELQLETWTTTEEDPDTGCATEGTLTVFDDFEVDEAQGHMNILEIENFLDTDFDWGADGEIDERKFGEAALNLTALIEGALGSQCFSFGTVWMHTRSSDAIDSNLDDYITPESLLLRNCTASGTKFHDLNANGERDEGDDGLEGFRIFADYDEDGILDDGEPSDVTDEDGNYEITDIEPPDGTYSLREELEDGGAGPWICSYPEDIVDDDGAFPCGWFDIDADEESNAENKDFGNYEKASITLVKDLCPMPTRVASTSSSAPPCWSTTPATTRPGRRCSTRGPTGSARSAAPSRAAARPM